MADGTTIATDTGKVDYAASTNGKQATAGTVSTSDAYDQGTIDLTKPVGVNYKAGDSLILQVGARSKDAVDFNFNYNHLTTLDEDVKKLANDTIGALDCTIKGLGLDKVTLTTQKDANAAIDKIDTAINKVSMVRATFGSVQNRLEHKIDNMNVTVENLTSAESRIRDTDMATEMMNFTKQNILTQASQSMLAQANQLPQSVLSLLQ